MKVVHVSPLYFSDKSVIGGAERYALELARATAAHTPTKLVTFGKRRQTVQDGKLQIEIYPIWFHLGGRTSIPYPWSSFGSCSGRT